METTELRFVWHYDEDVCEIYIDGDLIVEANYTDHGRAGLNDMVSAFKKLGKKMRWTILELRPDDPED